MNENIDILKDALKHKDDVLKLIDKYNVVVSKSNDEVKKENAVVNGEINRMQQGLKNGNIAELKEFANSIISKYADQNSK